MFGVARSLEERMVTQCLRYDSGGKAGAHSGEAKICFKSKKEYLKQFQRFSK